MSTRHDNADGPEDIDAAFAEIVAGLERDAPMSRWPGEADDSETDQDTGLPGATTSPSSADNGPPTGSSSDPASSPPEAGPVGPRDWIPPEETADEGHYEPPEPPPLPIPKPGTIGGILVISIGLLLLLIPGVAGVGTTVALPLGLVAISAGITWLLFRLRRGPQDPEDDVDDGAQV